jgi:hypothetical protein
MKKKLFLGVLAFAVFTSSVSFALDSMVMRFMDSSETGRVIRLVKLGSDRIFYECPAGAEEVSECVEIERIRVDIYESQEQFLADGGWEDFPEYLGSGAGSVVGFFAGALGAVIFADNPIVPRNGPKEKATALIILVASTYTGNRLANRLADWLDGTEFTTLETAALLTVFGNEQVIAPDNFEQQVYSNLTLEEFRAQLRLATDALVDRKNRGVDTSWIPFFTFENY